jgi:hypothetical protein
MATMGGAGLFTLMNPYRKPTNAPSENDLSRSFNTRFYNLRFFCAIHRARGELSIRILLSPGNLRGE